MLDIQELINEQLWKKVVLDNVVTDYYISTKGCKRSINTRYKISKSHRPSHKHLLKSVIAVNIKDFSDIRCYEARNDVKRDNFHVSAVSAICNKNYSKTNVYKGFTFFWGHDLLSVLNYIYYKGVIK